LGFGGIESLAEQLDSLGSEDSVTEKVQDFFGCQHVTQVTMFESTHGADDETLMPEAYETRVHSPAVSSSSTNTEIRKLDTQIVACFRGNGVPFREGVRT
jgi:hypothetical protein